MPAPVHTRCRQYHDGLRQLQVQWKVNTAGTTASNTADWEYVGIDAAAPSTITGKQTIKYWNYSAGQYDFIAYSTGDNKVVTEGDPAAGSVKVSAIAAPTTDYGV